MAKRDFLTLSDLSAAELVAVLELAREMKAGRVASRPLAGKALAMIFAKSSTRTRVAFEVGIRQLGGEPIFLSSRDLQLERGEPVRDTARVLSRMVDAIVIRTHGHAEVEELARYATVPVLNGLTDSHHPCQLLADLQTVLEEFGTLDGLVVAWIGDGNNMAHSWLEAAGLLGFELRLACPAGYEPDADIVRAAAERTRVVLTADPARAVAGARVVATDVWASMGQESEAADRRQRFQGYTVDRALMSGAAPDAIVLHCLPAHRGEEISDEVIEGPQSRVFDEAENRLHAQKALLATVIG
jgi:ornithine carbamoyltransferase